MKYTTYTCTQIPPLELLVTAFEIFTEEFFYISEII